MIDLNKVDGVALIRLNRGKVNAMSLDFCRRLIETLKMLEADQEVIAAVLIGNPRVFSAGVDLREVVAGDHDYIATYLPTLSECFKTVFQFAKPLVAAISGHAIAGGCVLASACDLRLIHAEAKIGLPELRIGVPLPSAGIEIMRFTVAPEALRAMVNVGQTYLGQAAVEVGLADRLVDPSVLEAEAIDAARGLTVVPPNVYRLSKQQQRAPAMRNIEANEAEFEAEVIAIWQSHENRKVVQAYVAERL
ncbi:MAG: enoyl-CoA hydratase/isomerase family protein [Planctomycetota bacterium]